MWCLFTLLGIANTVVNIIAVVASAAKDSPAMLADKGRTYYLALPIVSIVIPNPITTGLTAFTDCNDFNHCGESYRDLYTAAFALSLTGVCLTFCICFMCCFGLTKVKG